MLTSTVSPSPETSTTALVERGDDCVQPAGRRLRQYLGVEQGSDEDQTARGPGLHLGDHVVGQRSLGPQQAQSRLRLRQRRQQHPDTGAGSADRAAAGTTSDSRSVSRTSSGAPCRPASTPGSPQESPTSTCGASVDDNTTAIPDGDRRTSTPASAPTSATRWRSARAPPASCGSLEHDVSSTVATTAGGLPGCLAYRTTLTAHVRAAPPLARSHPRVAGHLRSTRDP